MGRFYIGKETINQGNAVIAVRDDSSNILWSWHIWVTSSDWSTPQMASSEMRKVKISGSHLVI